MKKNIPLFLSFSLMILCQVLFLSACSAGDDGHYEPLSINDLTISHTLNGNVLTVNIDTYYVVRDVKIRIGYLDLNRSTENQMCAFYLRTSLPAQATLDLNNYDYIKHFDVTILSGQISINPDFVNQRQVETKSKPIYAGNVSENNFVITYGNYPDENTIFFEMRSLNDISELRFTIIFFHSNNPENKIQKTEYLANTQKNNKYYFSYAQSFYIDSFIIIILSGFAI